MWSNISEHTNPNFISEFNLCTGVVVKQSALIYNPSVWHKIYVKNTSECNRDYILGKLMNIVHPLDFTPVSFFKQNDYVSFLLKNCGAALNELCRLNLTIAHDALNKNSLPFKIAIYLNYAHAKDLKIDIQENIVYVLKKRYSQLTRTLNLDTFYKDPDLQEFCPLSQPKLMYFILHVSKELEVETLKISNNGIRTLKPLEAYSYESNLKNCKILKCIDARKNNIDQMDELTILKNFQLTSLDLDENPICAKYNESEYLKHIRNLCPKLRKLDGCKVTGQFGILPLRRNYLCNLEALGLVDQFLEHYFVLYDTNRSVLEGLYHKNAFFSLNCTFNAVPQSTMQMGRRFNEYNKMSRNVKLISDLSKSDELLFYGSANITKALSLLPVCKHDFHSFTVDMPYYTGDTLVIIVSGVFKEPGQNLLDSDSFYGFTRTFVLKLKNNDEYNIINEMLHVFNASQTQIRKAFKIIKVAPVKTCIPIPIAKTNSDKEEMLDAFVKLTDLKPEWAKKCLIECCYDLKKSLELFNDFFKSEKIPVEAFRFYVESPKETITNLPTPMYQDMNIQNSFNQPYLSRPILPQTYETPLPTPMPVQPPKPIQPPTPIQTPIHIQPPTHNIQPSTHIPHSAHIPPPTHIQNSLHIQPPTHTQPPTHKQLPMPIQTPVPVQPPLPVQNPYGGPAVVSQPKQIPKPGEAPKPVPPPIIVQSNLSFQLNLNNPAKNIKETAKGNKNAKNLVTVNCLDTKPSQNTTKPAVNEPTKILKADDKQNVKDEQKGKPETQSPSRSLPLSTAVKVADPFIRAAININPNITQEEAKNILDQGLKTVLEKHCFALSFYRCIGKSYFKFKLFPEARNMLKKVMEKLNKSMGEEIYSTFTLYEIQFGDLTIAEEMVVKTAKTFPSFKTAKLIGEHIAKINPEFSRKAFEITLGSDLDMEKKKVLLKNFKDFEIKHGTKDTIENVNKLLFEIMKTNKPENQDGGKIIDKPSDPKEIMDVDVLGDKNINKPDEPKPVKTDQNKLNEDRTINRQETIEGPSTSNSVSCPPGELTLKAFRFKLFSAAGIPIDEMVDPEAENLKNIASNNTLVNESLRILTKAKYGLYYVKTICNVLWNRKLYSKVREILVQSKHNIKNMHLRNLVIYYKIQTDLNNNKKANALEKFVVHLRNSNNTEIIHFFYDLLLQSEEFAVDALNFTLKILTMRKDKLKIIGNIYKWFVFDKGDLDLFASVEKKMLPFQMTLKIIAFHPDDVLSNTYVKDFRNKYMSLSEGNIAYEEVVEFVTTNDRKVEAIIEGTRALFYHKKCEEGRNKLRNRYFSILNKTEVVKYRVAKIMFETDFGTPTIGYDTFVAIKEPDINMVCAAVCCLLKMKRVSEAKQLLYSKVNTLSIIVQHEVHQTILRYNNIWIKDYEFDFLKEPLVVVK